MARTQTSGAGRLIKKYPNRRLYDTFESRYITLGDIEKLVLSFEDFWIQDTKTKEDITRAILLQVIIEREEAGNPLLSRQVLEQLLRIYGHGMQDMAQTYLERSLTLWSETQELLQDHVTTPLPQEPANAMQELTERNLNLWREMQRTFLNAYVPGGKPRSED